MHFFNFLASLYSWAGPFEHFLVGRFSHVVVNFEALCQFHMMWITYKCKCVYGCEARWHVKGFLTWGRYSVNYLRTTFMLTVFFACGALAASIRVGIVIPSTWFVYLYKQTISITVVVMGTKQFNDKTTQRQQVKTGFVQNWEMGKLKSRTFPGLLQDFFIFQGLNFFPILYNTTFLKCTFFSQKRRNE